MNTIQSLSGSHLRTYETIFQHPISHNLGWRDVHSLFRHLGEVEEESNGNLRVTRNGETLVLHPPRTKDVTEMNEVMSLRHFLERSETKPAESNEKETHWLLVIDHHEARIFRSEMHGAIPSRSCHMSQKITFDMRTTRKPLREARRSRSRTASSNPSRRRFRTPVGFLSSARVPG